MAVNGSLMVVQVNTGTEAVPVWATVGSQRDTSISGSLGLIDASSKDSRNEVVLAGRWTGEVTLSHLYTPGAEEQQLLRDANRAGDVIMVRTFEDGTATEEAEGVVTEYNENHPDMDVSTADVTIHISNGWVVATP